MRVESSEIVLGVDELVGQVAVDIELDDGSVLPLLDSLRTEHLNSSLKLDAHPVLY